MSFLPLNKIPPTNTSSVFFSIKTNILSLLGIIL
jgi:hypothetical protein